MTSKYDIELLKIQKKELLDRKKTIPKENIDEIKEIGKEYFRIQKKIQYYTDEEHRKMKNTTDGLRHMQNKESYSQYQKNYYATKVAVSKKVF